jgi:hypothetical protein
VRSAQFFQAIVYNRLRNAGSFQQLLAALLQRSIPKSRSWHTYDRTSKNEVCSEADVTSWRALGLDDDRLFTSTSFRGLCILAGGRRRWHPLFCSSIDFKGAYNSNHQAVRICGISQARTIVNCVVVRKLHVKCWVDVFVESTHRLCPP